MKTRLYIYFLFIFALNSTANSQHLCQQFDSAAIPPTGWTINYSGTLYWDWYGVGAYGSAGCTRYKMWSAPTGTAQALITPVFLPTALDDSLIIDMAYPPYPSNPPYNQDSLIILASTDGGNVYIRLVSMGPEQLMTCNPAFNCNQRIWVKRFYQLPPQTNRLQFLGKSAFGNDLYIDSICITNHPIGIINLSEVAGKFFLEQNYPNPFNPSTKISYTIPNRSFVRLEISDAAGRDVSVPVNEFQQAGRYTVDFDASELASGVYFCRLKAGEYVSTKKMLLVK